MEVHELVLLSLYGIGTLTSICVGGLLWRYRNVTGAPALLVMMAAMVIWNGSLFLATLSFTTFAMYTIFIRTVFIGVALVTLAKLAFVLEYTGREHMLRPRILVPLAIPPVLTLFLVFVNPADLFFETLEPAVDGSGMVELEFGRAALVPLLYSYGLNVVVTVLILGFVYRSRAIYRGQSIALLGGALAPWIANMVYVTNTVPYDVTAIGSVVSGVLFTIAITRYRLFDIMPIARDRVLDTINDAVFVVDHEERLIDVNPVGRRMFGEPDGDAVGRSLETLLADEPTILETYRELTERQERNEREVSYGGRHYLARATPIDDGRDRHVGWLVLVQDVTERKRRESKLERQNERLEQFASILSHDLRNPLNVADGYVGITRETGDTSYLDEVEESHARMNAIIEDVLAITREGYDVGEREPVSLAVTANRAWRNVATDGATLSVVTDATVLADPDRLSRLFENLFRNATEHGADGDPTDLRVTVDVTDSNGRDGFYVEDDGVGIPPEVGDRVLENGFTMSESGTGLGLGIVTQIAEAHGWSIRIAEGEAGGARFVFDGVEVVDAPEVTERRI